MADCNLVRLKELSTLAVNGNKLKDMLAVINVINQLPKLEVNFAFSVFTSMQRVYVENNVFWPLNSFEKEKDQEKEVSLRIKFLGGITQLDHLGARFGLLNKSC